MEQLVNAAKAKDDVEHKKKFAKCNVCMANAMIDWEVACCGEAVTQPDENEHVCLPKYMYISAKFTPRREPSNLSQKEKHKVPLIVNEPTKFTPQCKPLNLSQEKKTKSFMDNTTKLKLLTITKPLKQDFAESLFGPPPKMAFESIKLPFRDISLFYDTVF